MNIHPWQVSVWQRFFQQKSRLSHALLLHGRAGIGKQEFAYHLSKALLCSTPKDTEACNICPQCTWFNEGAHPDFKYITPEDADVSEDAPKKKSGKKTQISVDQIRQLIQVLSLTNHGVSSLRVVLIHPAESLNTASANALLKVLEEPPNNTIFVLVTNQIHRLLPTILSRCQSVAMPVPSRDAAIEWLTAQKVSNAADSLDYNGGSPLTVLQMQTDLAAHASIFQQLAKGARVESAVCAALLLELGMEQAITTLQKWVYDLQLMVHQLPVHYHKALGKPLQALVKSVNLSILLEFQRLLVQAKLTANHPLSQELQLESLLLQYKKAFKPSSSAH